ncbi:MAG TPA: dicarboxylate/amino acid:cation symporter [Candidatus Polarisedimenticolaceae bacterium]
MRVALHTRMLIGGAAGVSMGLAAHAFLGDSPGLAWTLANVAQPAGQIFLRLLFMLVIPLIFSALILGVAGLGDLRHLGRVGLKTLAYTVVVSTIAVLLGIFLVHVLRPGEGLSEQARTRLMETASQRASGLTTAAAPKTGIDLLVQIVPSNPFKAAAEGDMLAVMFFSLMMGIGVAVVRTDAARRFEEAVQGLYDVTMRLIGMVIALAPIGIAALLFSMTATLGAEVILQLARYVGVVLLALVIHQFVVYALSVKLLGGMSPIAFYRGIDEAMLTAFSTASSNATLPTALRVAQDNLKLPAHVSRFVLTIGSTANQNGTALYEGVTVLFLAQFYGVDLSFGDQALVVSICILAGIGTAGIPGGSLPVIAMILKLVHVPTEGIGLILGVDRFLDMCRTTLNVTGDLAAAVVVSRGEEAPPR